MLEELRKTLASLERPPGLEDPGIAPLGIKPIDAALGGGLARGALHEIAAVSEAHIASACGFAVGLARTPSPRLRGEGRGEGDYPYDVLVETPPHPNHARKRARSDLSPQAGRGKAIIWVAEDMALIESG